MGRLLIFACLLGTSLAFTSGGGSGGGRTGFGSTVSKREQTEGPASICLAVRELLDQARQGIIANDLGGEAAVIQTAADAWLNAQGGEVPTEEVQKLINATAASFNAQSTVTALFGDPLTYSGEILDASLTLLSDLCDAEDSQEAGGSSKAVMAAISLTTGAIQNLVQNVVSYVTYLANSQPEENPAKRYEIEGTYKHTPQEDAWNAQFKHSGKNWEAGIGGGYSTQSGWNAGATFTYRFRR